MPCAAASVHPTTYTPKSTDSGAGRALTSGTTASGVNTTWQRQSGERAVVVPVRVVVRESPAAVGVGWPPAWVAEASVCVSPAVLGRLRLVGARDEVRRLDGDEDREQRGEGGDEAAERSHAVGSDGAP